MNDSKTYDSNYTDGIGKDFLNITLKEMMSIIKAECGSLFLFDYIRKELVLDSFYNSKNLHLEGLRLRIGEGISGKVVDYKTAVLVKDINRDLRFRGNGFRHYRTNSFISLPLLTSKGILGLINLADKSSGQPFTEKDLEFAVSLSKYACIIVENILRTAKLKQEKDTLDKQKSLLEKYASVGKLAAGVVHEINNPLDGIIRYTNILLNQIENNSIVREYLLEVKKGLNRIANITKSLLEFSHQVNNDLPLVKKYVDVNKLIDESLCILEDKIDGKIQINKKYSGSCLKISDLGLQQVILNVIKNALDAMPEGGKLEILTDIKDSVVEVSFRDTGLGIPSEIIDRIFEPFFTTKAIDKGTGLGLSISKEIINKYEGEIEVRSLPGEGSTFIILIPKKYLANA